MEDQGLALPATYFAPPERASAAELEIVVRAASGNPVIDALLRGMRSILVVLNPQRQIVAFNDEYLRFIGVAEEASAVLGLRLGESAGCVHRAAHPAGCGTGPTCGCCGAVVAVVGALQTGEGEEQECALSIERGGDSLTLDLRVQAVPFAFEGLTLVLVFLADISDLKRKAALERAFLHDINNVLVGLMACSSALSDGATGTQVAAARQVQQLVQRLAREVDVQRALDRPGSQLRPDLQPTGVLALLTDLQDAAGQHPAALARSLCVRSAPQGLWLQTDHVLLTRVLTNMVLNALEAAAEGAEVRVWVEEEPDALLFQVWNPGEIPPAVQARIFQRYFSTKPGLARGQGTFAIKDLGERHLGGKVGFRSSADEGTTFWIRLPRRAPQP